MVHGGWAPISTYRQPMRGPPGPMQRCWTPCTTYEALCRPCQQALSLVSPGWAQWAHCRQSKGAAWADAERLTETKPENAAGKHSSTLRPRYSLSKSCHGSDNLFLHLNQQTGLSTES